MTPTGLPEQPTPGPAGRGDDAQPAAPPARPSPSATDPAADTTDGSVADTATGSVGDTAGGSVGDGSGGAAVGGERNGRSVVSFVRRGGRITVGQQRAWDTYWGTLGRDVTALPEGPLETDGWFGRSAPLLLEIGSGMGETTACLANAEPDVNYLAVEVYEPGLAQLMLRAEALELTNLRLLRGDAVTLLTDHMPPGSLAGARIFFPDPWPKKRHYKRRLVQSAFVALLADRLAPGARLHLATDWADYADQMLAVCSVEPLLCNEFSDADGGWAPRPDWRPVTKFERRAREEGRISRDLMFRRRG